jgi:hypothetical protein
MVPPMQGLTMDGRNGESIRSPHDMFGRFTAELTPQIQPWRKRPRKPLLARGLGW